jgi:GTPase SAR1 family protein
MIVFDISKPRSLESVLYWVTELNNYTSENTPRILFGNKQDLLEGPINTELQQEIFRICTEHKLIYFAGSAKTGHNVTEAEETLIAEGYKSLPESMKIPNIGPTPNPAPIPLDPRKEKKKNSCC